MVQEKQRFVVGPEEGEILQEAAVGVVAKIWGTETNGVISIVEHPVAPGALVPPHTHQSFDEWSYVLEGQVGARIGDTEFTAGPGSYILKPRAIPHTFWNAGPDPARLIELITPAGFERFFERLGEMLRDGSFSPEELERLGEQYGTTYSYEWVPELEERYEIKLLGTE